MRRAATWLATLRTALGLCFRADPWRATGLFAGEIGFTLLLLLSTYGFRLIVDAAVRRDGTGALLAAGVTALTYALGLVASRANLRLGVAVTERAGLLIDTRLMALTGGLPTIEHHERPRYADELTLIRQEREAMAQAVNAFVVNLRVAALLAGGVAILVHLDPVLIALPLFGLPAVAATRAANRLRQRAREANAERVRLRDHLYEVGSAPSAAGELRIFGLAGEVAARHAAVAEAAGREAARASLQGDGLAAAGAFVFAAGYVGALWVLFDHAVQGTTTIGSVVLALSLAVLINLQVAAAAQVSGYLQQVVKAAGRLLWLEAYAERAAWRPGPQLPAPDRMQRGIEVRQVSFAYPDTSRLVLDGVDLQLPAGAVVALVGENGSGKTTLVKLLTGLFRPGQGAVLVDGVDLQRFDLHEWRRRVSGAFQDFWRPELILREAVGTGDLPRLDDPLAVSAALARAGARELRRLQPAGLQTQLGSTWGGVDLSGGQWQKLALGRALMRDAPLLTVFDEPTSALDAETEHALFQRLAAAARSSSGGVTLLVSHRFTTVRTADVIVVLDHGRVVETGDHAALVRAGGLYAELFELQSRGYR